MLDSEIENKIAEQKKELLTFYLKEEVKLHDVTMIVSAVIFFSSSLLIIIFEESLFRIISGVLALASFVVIFMTAEKKRKTLENLNSKTE